MKPSDINHIPGRLLATRASDKGEDAEQLSPYYTPLIFLNPPVRFYKFKVGWIYPTLNYILKKENWKKKSK